MMVLVYFRKDQRNIDTKVDEELITPADYTLCVKNIPKDLDVDYKKELKYIMENHAVLNSEEKIQVRKVVLVYNIDEFIELEEKLNELVEKKKEAIIRSNYNYESGSVKKFDE